MQEGRSGSPDSPGDDGGHSRAAAGDLRLDVAGRPSTGGELRLDVAGRPCTGGELRLDVMRQSRTGEPEVVLGEGKSPAQCADAVAGLLAETQGPVIASRVDPAQAAAIQRVAPQARYVEEANLLVARAAPPDPSAGRVAIATGGTADMPVAREALEVLEAFGIDTALRPDIGIAGLHRLLDERDVLAGADVIIAVAGMEGALPTAVAGLVPAPVVAVPTSVGYGASFDGIAALLGMLTSCAPGVVVVNIDSGFGAAMAARRMLRLRERE